MKESESTSFIFIRILFKLALLLNFTKYSLFLLNISETNLPN